MNHRLNELHLKRGRLLERIAVQRVALRQDLQPICATLVKADRLQSRVQSVFNYFRQHPGIVAAGVALLIVSKPSRLWRWSTRAFSLWRIWRGMSKRWLGAVMRARF